MLLCVAHYTHRWELFNSTIMRILYIMHKHSTRTHMLSHHVCLLCTCSKRCLLLVCAGLLRIGSLYAQTSNKNCRFFCVHTQFTHMFSVLCACSLSIIMRMLNISLLSLSVCSVLANKSKPIPSRTGEINHL